METELTLAGKIQAGATWLDDNYPGWHNHIHTFSLDMTDGNRCILGQVFRKMVDQDKADPFMAGFAGYVQLLNLHDVEWQFPAEHGFCWRDDDNPFPDEAHAVWVRQSTLLWISEVGRRISADTQAGEAFVTA